MQSRTRLIFRTPPSFRRLLAVGSFVSIFACTTHAMESAHPLSEASQAQLPQSSAQMNEIGLSQNFVEDKRVM